VDLLLAINPLTARRSARFRFSETSSTTGVSRVRWRWFGSLDKIYFNQVLKARWKEAGGLTSGVAG
jgi:hypothetical protein